MFWDCQTMLMHTYIYMYIYPWMTWQVILWSGYIAIRGSGKPWYNCTVLKVESLLYFLHFLYGYFFMRTSITCDSSLRLKWLTCQTHVMPRKWLSGWQWSMFATFQIKDLDCLSKFVAMGTVNLANNDVTWAEVGKLRNTHILELNLHGNKQLEKDPYCK